MKKQKIISLGLMGFLIIVILIGIASATMYDELTALKTKNCNLVEKTPLSPSVKAALINKFGFVLGSNCDFVVDSLPIDPSTRRLLGFSDAWYTSPWYAEIMHVFDGNEEYFFVSGRDDSVLNIIAGLAADYERYQYYLTNDKGFYLPEDFLTEHYNPEYIGPVDEDCVDTNGNVYTGNSGSYRNLISGETINFNLACANPGMLLYPFCKGESFVNSVYPCNCVANKCVADFSEVFSWSNAYGLNAGPGNTMVDNDLISSALKSWMDS
jgi:hypothetical protein